jgi:hypothetical protein
MRIRLTIVTALLALLASAAGIRAHDEYRVIGTVTRVSTRLLDVKQTRDGKKLSMKLDAATLVTRDKEKVGVAALKPGQSVVVDASGDSLEDLVALEVRIVPPPAR